MDATARYDSLFQFYAPQYGLDWLLLKAQAKIESNFDPNVVSCKVLSPVGAMGLAQFMPATWKQYGEGIPSNPEESIKAQCKMMRDMLMLQTEPAWALASYNYGIGNVRKVRAKCHGTFQECASELPGETVDYVDKILTLYETYRKA